MPREPKEPTIPQETVSPDNANRDVLSFKEFCKRDDFPPYCPRHGNFFAYFAKGSGGYLKIKRGQAHYKRFKAENPDLDESTKQRFESFDDRRGTSEALKPYESYLYEAYKIMKSYGVSDKILF